MRKMMKKVMKNPFKMKQMLDGLGMGDMEGMGDMGAIPGMDGLGNMPDLEI